MLLPEAITRSFNPAVVDHLKLKAVLDDTCNRLIAKNRRAMWLPTGAIDAIDLLISEPHTTLDSAAASCILHIMDLIEQMPYGECQPKGCAAVVGESCGRMCYQNFVSASVSKVCSNEREEVYYVTRAARDRLAAARRLLIQA